MTAPTLPEFILARVAEDEAVARAALSGRFTWASVDFNSAACANHGDRHDPDRVLAQCAAYRRIVERHSEAVWCGNIGCERAGRSGLHCITCDEPEPCPDLRTLASIWADRPDYREEWKP